MSRFAPFSFCSSSVGYPPEKAYLLIFFLMSLAESVTRIEVVGSDEDIFDFLPCRAGKKVL